jgi:hypothetical protein
VRPCGGDAINAAGSCEYDQLRAGVRGIHVTGDERVNLASGNCRDEAVIENEIRVRDDLVPCWLPV